MSETKEYKCTSCGAPLHFDGNTGKLKCDYCDSEYTVEEVELLTNKIEETGEAEHWDYEDEILEGYAAYHCNSCGAELIVEDTMASCVCPYCNNPMVVNNSVSGIYKPKFVLPFEIDHKKAVEILKKHYSTKKLIPDAFVDENHISEIKGVYAPYWLISAVCDADMTFEGSLVHTYSTHNERVTETDHYHLKRAGSVNFERVPVDASSKLSNEYMDALEPFDYSKIQPFAASYLAGYMADRYDQTADDVEKRADERIVNTTESMIRNTTAGYGNVIKLDSKINLYRGDVEYAYIPVWILCTRWNDQDYLFMINGQTGKVAGELPSDSSKTTKEFIKTFLVTFLIVGAMFAFIFMQ